MTSLPDLGMLEDPGVAEHRHFVFTKEMVVGVGGEGGSAQKDKGAKEGSDEGVWVEKGFLWLCKESQDASPGFLWAWCYLLSLTLEFGAHGRFSFALGELDK